MTLITPPPLLYIATRRSSYHSTEQPYLRYVDVRHSNQPVMWATQDHAKTTHSEQVWNSQPERVCVTATVTPAPYTRSLDLTIEFFDFPSSLIDVAIIAASDNATEVHAAMSSDMSNFVEKGEKRGWTVRQRWSDYNNGRYCGEKCHAEAVIMQTRQTTWWDFWNYSLKPKFVASAARDGIRVPTEQEEKGKLVLGQALLDMTKYEEDGEDKESPDWAEMGLVRVGAQEHEKGGRKREDKT